MSSPAPALKSTAGTAQLLRCWCGANEWLPCFKAKPAGLAKCAKCGCYQTDPPPLSSGENSQDFYTQYYTDLEITHEPVKDPATSRGAGFWRVAEQFKPLLTPATRVVDVGCGDGNLCAELRGAGWPQVVGVEASRTRVARARKFYPEITFYDCFLEATPEPKASFDTIVMEAVIEHLPEPVDCLRGLRQYAKKGAWIVLTTPNMDSGHFKFLGKRWTGMLAPHAHIFLFTASSLSMAMEQAGFRVKATGSYEDGHFTIPMLARRFASGDVKGALWRAHQEIGTAYGRKIGQGPMLWAVGQAE